MNDNHEQDIPEELANSLGEGSGVEQEDIDQEIHPLIP